MRVAIVSQYYRPEPGATQNRMGAFTDGLLDRGHEVTVVCEQPNHPAGVFHPGFGRRPVHSERCGRLTVHRLWVATTPHKTTRRRLAFYGSFAAGAAACLAAARCHDVVLATSPPMPGAIAAAVAARLRGTPFVLDVRDLWPAAAEALGELSDARVIGQLERVERALYRTAHRVTATTRPFCTHIDEIAGRSVSEYLPNGALDSLLDGPDAPLAKGAPFVVGYAGNLGIAQGLGIVLDAAELLHDDDIRFVIVGDGPVGSELRGRVALRGLTNVEVRPGVPTDAVGAFLASCHALLVPLRAHSLLESFVPSKLFDAMAVGRPVIVAARGEAAVITREAQCGVVVAPEDGGALAVEVRALASDPDRARALGAAGRRAAPAWARSAQLDRLEAVLQDAARRRELPRGTSCAG